MRRQVLFGRCYALTFGTMLVLGLALLAVTLTAQADQPAEQAYDHYIGHFGAKNVKPPYITGAISAKYYAAGTCPTPAWCESGDDLLTGGSARQGCCSPHRLLRILSRPPRRNSAATPSTPTTAPCWTSFRRAATGHFMDRM